MLSRRFLKRLMIVFFSLSALVLLCVNAFLVWVVTGPRSLEAITPYLESELNATDGSYIVKIGSSVLSWDGWERPVGIHIRDVKVADKNGNAIAGFPDVGVRISIFKLLVGTLDINSLEINSPTLLLYQGEDGSVSLGFTEAAAQDTSLADSAPPATSLPAALVMFSSGEGNTPVTRLKAITITNARIAIKNKRSGVFFYSEKAFAEIRRVAGKGQGQLVLPFAFGDNSGKVQADFTVDGNEKVIRASTRFSNLPSELLYEIFPLQGWLKSVKLPLAGAARMRADFEGHVESLAFNALAGEGKVEYASEFTEPLAIKKIQLEGELTKRFTSLQLKSGVVDLGDVVLSFGGHFRKEQDKYAVDATIHSENIPVDRLNAYWPRSVSPHTRAWVTSRISKGVVSRADVGLHFKPGELELPYTPTDSIAAAMDVKGISVLYMPSHPPVTDVDGHLDFTGSSMRARVQAANYMSGTKVKAADLHFPDLNAPDVPLFMEIDVSSPAADVYTFLALPNLDKAKKLGITKDIKGSATGKAKIDFIAFSEDETKNNKDVPDINYALTGKLEGVAQPKFLGKYDVENATMTVALDNKGIKAEGKAVINTVPMDVVADSRFNATHTTKYSLKLDLPVEKMPLFDLPKLDFLKGNMGVQADFASTDTSDSSAAELDITNVAVALEQHGYTKKAGDKATLELATEKLASGNTAVTSFRLEGGAYAATGKAEIDGKTSEFSSLVFSGITTGKHDLDLLDYRKTSTGIEVTARGKALDLSPYLKMDKAKEETGLKADVKADKVVLGEGRALYAVNAKVDCPTTCATVELTSKLEDKTPFTYSIRNGQLAASCDNAGDLLRALNMYGEMQGGKLSLDGRYEGRKIKGKAFITDFSLRNAPILTKMFTMASLTGIVDTLGGKGIAFDKLSAPYEYDRGEITVKDAKQFGPALGITANGSLSLTNASYDMGGTLVPSYTLNSLVGKIPLLGGIIVGGEGKGLFALSYTIKGAMETPDISVNPLSVLTPGFLRGVFDIFDQPAPSKEKLQEMEKQIINKKNTDSIAK